ncbi:general amino acid permease agp2 [Emydomyces testavorans]|uniref:General amino acid permease agp2 n=1 Tax=Emydomyces testavorans TaxID=2070801 RepID=A0AAF0DBR6_9EURO|nr:general amino acid permease agp2 [Emydomyces testavorans]
MADNKGNSTPRTAMSTALKSGPMVSQPLDPEKHPADSLSSQRQVSRPGSRTSDDDDNGGASLKPPADHTHRKLKPRHIQLIGIGGTIGTALFVQIGKGLISGGPASLFMAFTLWYKLGFMSLARGDSESYSLKGQGKNG